MNIVSFQFFIFAFIVLALVLVSPKRWQNPILLGASLVFYATWNLTFVAILIIVTTINFFAGIWVKTNLNKKLVFWAILILNILALALFRMLDSRYVIQFLFPMDMAALASQEWVKHFLLPVGFSFYVLQAISYQVDVSQKRIEPERNFVDFSLYMAYFPRLLSGPIERARTFLPKIKADRVIDNSLLSRAFTLVLVGLFRKIVLADTINSLLQNDYFQTHPYGIIGLVNLLGYAFYLYNDFAGYTSIVRGISCLFGIELSPNFVQPYLSRSLTEFWARWHISLSEWLRDYIYFPLSRWLLSRSGNRRNAVNTYLPPLVTMMVSGLWHGFTPAMLFWGILHGIYLMGERLIFNLRPSFRPTEGKIWRQLITGLITFSFVAAAWSLFKFGGLRESIIWLEGIFIHQEAIEIKMIYGPLLLFLLSMFLDWLQYHYKEELITLKLNLWARAGLTAIVIISLVVTTFLNSYIPQPAFIYLGF